MLNNFKHLLLTRGLICLFLLILSVSLVGQSGYLSLDVSITHPTSCTVKDGTINITPLNGTPPYQYSLNGGTTFTTNSTISNLGIGSYVISVKDAEKRLSNFEFVQLVIPNGPRVEGVSVEHPTKCGEGGKIVITANGAPREPLWYSIDGGATYLDETWFQNLSRGSYNIVVANQDTTCLATYPTFEFNPIEPSRFISGSVNATAPTCGNSDGFIEIIVAGNKNDYEFSIDRGLTFQNDNVFGNLGEGNYSVVVKQVEQNCQKEIEVVVFNIAGCPPVPCDALLQNAFLEINSCTDIATYCLNLPLSDLEEYLITVNEQPYTDLLHLCSDNASYAAIQLAVGTHFINVTSKSGLCNVSANVTVECLYDGSKDCELLVNEVADVATYDATYDYCLNIPLAELEAYNISVNGQPYTQEIAVCQSDNSLAALLFNQGTHYIIIAAKNGFCSDTATVKVTSPFDPDNPDYCSNLLMDQVVELANFEDKNSFCLNIPYTALSQYEIMINGQPANQQMLLCGEDTNLAAIYVGKGTYFISITHENGTCSNSATFRVTCPFDPTDEDYCSNLLEDQTIDLGDNLEGTYDLCLNIPLAALPEYTILVNGQPPTQQEVICSENNSLIGLILERGSYFIEITHENGTCRDNATIQVTGQYDPYDPEFCNNLIANEAVEITHFDEVYTYCLGIPYTKLEEYVITINEQPLPQELVICSEDNNLIGVYLGRGVHQISITHENGICKDVASVRVSTVFDESDPEYCKGLIKDERIELAPFSNTVTYCLNIPRSQVDWFNIIVNGVERMQETIPCPSDNSLAALVLGVGTHNIELIYENDICTDEAIIEVAAVYNPDDSVSCSNLISDQVFNLTQYGAQQYVCLNIPKSAVNDFEIKVNGHPPTQNFLVCREDTTLIGLLFDKGTYLITLNHQNGSCNDTATVRITSPFDPDDPTFCNTIIEDQVIEIEAADNNYSFCLNIPIAAAPSYTITVNGHTPTQNRLACSGDTSLLALYLEQGTHFIELVHENGTCTDNATIVVRSKFDLSNPEFCDGLIEDDRIALNLFSDKKPYCLNIPLSEIDQFTIKVNGFDPTQEIVPCPSDPSLAALVFERGSYQIAINHSNGICKDFASVEFYAPYNPNDPDYCNTLIHDTVLDLERFGDQHYYCLNIPATSINDFDIKVNGKTPDQQTLVCREDTTLIGLLFQKGTYFVTLNHQNGICNDSATVRVTCPFDPTDPDFCENLLENKVFELAAPGATMPLCLNIPMAALPAYEITVNGHLPTQDITTCSSDTSLVALEFTEGTYYITIQHENGLCSDTATVRFDAPTNWEDSTLCSTLISNATFTAADTNDLIPLCLNIPLGEVDNFVLTLSGSGSSINQNIVACEADTSLAALYLGIGQFDISITHLNGVCKDEATVLVNPPFDPSDSLSCNNLIGDSVFKLDTLGATYPFCLNIPLTEVPNFNITINGDSLIQTPAACASNSIMAAVMLQEGVHVIELKHQTGTCTDKATIRIINPEIIDSLDCSALIENGAYELIDSGGIFRYCLNIPQTEITNFLLQVNKEGIGVSPTLASCAQNPNLVALALQQGLYTIYLTHTDSMCTDSATIRIDNPKDEQAELDQDCKGFLRTNEILELTDCDTLATYCLNLPLSSSNSLQLTVDGTITNNLIPCTATGELGVQLGRGMHTLMLSSDSTTCVDTGSVFVRCLPPELLQFTDTLQFNQTDTFCIDTTLLPGKIVSISNECPEKSGTIIDFVVDTSTLCIIYSSQELAGQEEACIVICNEAGDCGTIKLTVTVAPKPPLTFADTISLNTFDIHCIDTSQLAGTIVSIENICPESSGEAVIFTVNTASYCVTYTGMEAGTEKACIRVCDDTGQCFITEFTITVEDERLSYRDTITPNATAIYCVDPTLLPGRIVSIRNTCPEAAGTAAGVVAGFAIDTSAYCVTYTGLIPGTAKACIEICTIDGVCTTINMTIVVETPADTLKAPIAVADRDSTLAEETVVIDVLKNDTLFTMDSIDIKIVAVPPNGILFVNPDGTISYIPNKEFCDDEDLFMYQVCTPAGCDTARVYVYVTCTMIEIFPAFSPNGDGVNDTFVINGLSSFPNHVLQVYDRRGTRVLFAEKYQNDWNGTWNGRDLPDGIYYYVLDDGAGKQYDGYLQIRR